ncbi:MAG: ABC transporter substrate-binding protein [Candidatus Rokubacteria bacterium]|nr:ABC transporter substrate-binding protein [Candidatus Rokubacteria bacterium]
MRRSLVALVVMSGLLAALAAAGWSQSSTAAKGPIRIGVMYPFTGPFAFLGEMQLLGMRLAFEQRGNRVAGREIQLIVADDEGKPETGVTKIRKLIEQDHVAVLTGIVSSSVAYAVRSIVHEAKTPLVITMANAGGLTRDQRSPYIFRTFQPGGTGSFYMAKWLYEKSGKRKAVFSASDYAYGREHAEMFRKGFQAAGGKVLAEVFAPLGTPDFGPYVTQIQRVAADADILYIVYSGTDAIRFVKTYAEYGLKDRLPIANWGATTDGQGGLVAMGDAALGAYQMTTYFVGLDLPANRKFVEQVKPKVKIMDSLVQNGHIGGDVIVRALEAVQGNVEDTTAFLQALRSVRFDSTLGPFRFDAQSQNALVNLYVTRADRVDGEIRNVIVATIPEAQDPWWLEKR